VRKAKKFDRRVLLVALFFAVVGAALYFWSVGQPQPVAPGEPGGEHSVVTVKFMFYGIRADAEANAVVEGYNATAYSALLLATGKLGFAVSEKRYDAGVFVESIAGLKQGDYGHYWVYTVNGALPKIAADRQAVRQGDVVVWHFENDSSKFNVG
jgi:hypothetical protein